MSTPTSPADTLVTPASMLVPETSGAHYVRLMRQTVLHPDDAFHQEAVEQLDRLCRPWHSMDSADLRAVLEGIHDELLILLHQIGPQGQVATSPPTQQVGSGVAGIQQVDP
jgi:hypothetical protein